MRQLALVALKDVTADGENTKLKRAVTPLTGHVVKPSDPAKYPTGIDDLVGFSGVKVGVGQLAVFGPSTVACEYQTPSLGGSCSSPDAYHIH